MKQKVPIILLIAFGGGLVLLAIGAVIYLLFPNKKRVVAEETANAKEMGREEITENSEMGMKQMAEGGQF